MLFSYQKILKASHSTVNRLFLECSSWFGSPTENVTCTPAALHSGNIIHRYYSNKLISCSQEHWQTPEIVCHHQALYISEVVIGVAAYNVAAHYVADLITMSFKVVRTQHQSVIGI